MKKRLTRLVTIAFLLSLVTSNVQTASTAEDYLLSVDMSRIDQWSNNDSRLLPKSAQINQVRYRIPSSNPDNLIGQIVLDYPLADKQELYNSKWTLGLWIYGQALYCAGDKSCDFILNVYAKYPKAISILTWKKSTDEKSVVSDCPGTHYISDADGTSVINFSMSISCLNLPKQFASYAYSGFDVGTTPTPHDFTSGGYVENPFHQLAKQSYDKNGGKQGLSKTTPTAGSTAGGKQVCVSATSGTGYSEKCTLDEQCSDSNQWEFTYCDVHPKAELQVFKNKRWQKVKIVNGVSEGTCEDVDQPYEYIQSSPIIGKYRVKHYGDKKFSTAYLNLKIERKNSI